MTRQTGSLPTIIPDNSAIGLVLMSDANGNTSWQPITAPDLPARAGGYCLVVAASGATTAVKNSADYVCTGTGDQAVINTAIAALPAAGGTIQLSAGTFNITGQINIAASNITLEGTGNSTKIQVAPGTNITEAISVSGTGTVEVKIRRLWINGTITDTFGDGILINTPWSTTDTQHVFEDLYITGCPNNGIHVATSADTRVMLFNRVHVKGCNGNGFYLAYPSCTDSVFTDCIADTIALNGFFIGAANCWFENCKAFYCGSGGAGNYGFYIVGYNNYFTGCQAQDNYRDGFFGDNTGDATYGSFGCTFVNCSGDANGQAATSSGLRGHGVQEWQVTGGVWMTRPYETSWTQAYGITWEDATAGPSGLRASSKNTVTGALFRNNGTANIHDTSTGPNYQLSNVFDSGTSSNTLPGSPLAIASGGTGTASSAVYNVKAAAYGAKGDGQYVNTGAITNGQNTLTVGSSVFAAGDVGKNIIIYGAGASGAHLGNATITAFTSATQVTISANASTTVTNAIVVWATNDTTAIQAAVTAGGSAGSIYLPAGIYLVKAGFGNNLNGCRIYGEGAGSVTDSQQAFASGSGTYTGSCIVCDTSMSSASLVASTTTASFREFDHLSVVWTAAGGRILASEGVVNSPATIHDCRFEVNDPGGSGQVTASFVVNPFGTWTRCGFVQTSSTRQLPLLQSLTSNSGADANITFDQCQWYNAGTDVSQYLVDIEFQANAATGDGYAAQISFTDCTFGRAWGGAVKLLGAADPLFENCGFWDMNGGPSVASAPNPGTLYFGQFSASTTVAAGSNGGEISTIATWGAGFGGNGILDVASTTGFPSSGTLSVAASGPTTALVSYTGVTSTTFTGCAYVSGSATGTVSTGGAVSLTSSPCRGVLIYSGFKNRSWADGSHVWDVYCESTTQGVLIQQFSTKPDSNSSGANFYCNFNGCTDVTMIGCQAPTGNNPGATTISNAPASGVTVLNGSITALNTTVGSATTSLLSSGSGVLGLTNATTAPSGTPSGGGVLYGAGGQPNYLDSGGKLWNLAQPMTWGPQDSGWLEWAYDPRTINNSSLPTNNTITLVRVNVRAARSVTNVILAQVAVGTSLTTGQNFAGIYAGQTAGAYTAGQLIGTTADQTTNWGTGTNIFRTAALVGAPFAVPAGFVWVAILCNSTGASPGFGRDQNTAATWPNAGMGVAQARWATNTTGTSLPGSITPGNNTLTQITYWAAIS